MNATQTILAAATSLVAFGWSSVLTAAPQPGDVVSLFYVTDAGSVDLPGVPPVPKEVGALESKNYRMDDGRVISVAVQRVGSNHVTYAMSSAPNDGVRQQGAVVYASDCERFCGLMERVVDGGQGNSWRPGMKPALDLRGEALTMVVKPTLGLYAPFYISTAGYGIHVEGTWPGEYDMARSDNHHVRFAFEGPRLAFHVFRGKPLDLCKMHASVVGMPVLPPRWVFTPWRWRDDHTQREAFWDGTPYSGHFNAEIVEDVLMMEAFGIPCGVYWVDRPWAKGEVGYEDFEFDRERLPNPAEMIQWLTQRDMRFLLWIAPWTLGDMNKVGEEKGYFLKSTRNEQKDHRRLIDFTNPDAVAWWQRHLKKVIDVGVAGFKLDRSEEIVPNSYEQKTHSGMTTREMHNAYPVMYAKATRDALQRERGDDFVIMPRAGYTGSQQYAIFWGGDTSGTPWGLRSAIIAVQRAATMGFVVWGADTGGYHHGYNRDTMARWLAFSAFCPLMEVGPTRNKGLWNCPWEPSYDAELIAIWTLYAQVHDRIGDYIYEYARRAHETGQPIVRPLWVQFPDDPQAPAMWDEYMLGDDILVCPIWGYESRIRRVYLPAGRWRDAWEPDKVHTGPAHLDVQCPLHKIPVFVREGASVKLGDLEGTYKAALERANAKPNMGELLQKAGMK
jgi:alpha-D-xyloside xylohydrolase